jgi:Tol biopolymer transport system component
MTTRQMDQDDLDRLMHQWMDDEAAVHEPADLVDRVLAGTRRSRQLPAWLVFDRWTQMQLTMRRAAAPRLAPLLLLVGLLIAALLAALVYVGSRPKVPPPFGVAANGRIAFVSDNQLFTIEPDGSGVVQLTNDPFGSATPVFSHDGTRIAYKRTSDNQPPDDPERYVDLVVANADGSDPVAIDTRVMGMSPTAWSPDDREVLWTGTTIADGDEQVFVAPADGSSPALQIGDPTTFNWGPGWSPDGTMISYVSEHDFLVMNRDGTGIRTVSQGAYDQQSGGGWDPTGSGLIFSAGSEANHDLWLVGLDGQPEHVLARTVYTEEAPAFSPDGQWVAFLRFAPDGRSTNVAVIRVDGSAERTLPGVYGFSGVMWSPDGTRLLVGGPNPALVYELDPFGNEKPRLLDLPGSQQFPPGQSELPAWQRRAL